MPKINKELPEKLRPYLFHGIDLDYQPGVEEVACECPWCGREGKFSINSKTGQWRCFVCAEGTDKGGGNALVFLRRLWELSDQSTGDYEELATDRHLLSQETLSFWGVAKSIATDDWIVPGYGIDGKIHQIYRYLSTAGKSRLLPTPTLGHQLHGVYDQRKPIVYLCEGPWDGMALWEALGRAKPTDNGLAFTASPDHSLLASSCVLAVPGCAVFFESWLPLFAGKTVRLMYDNDHPKKHQQTGQQIPPAGLTNMQRVARILAGAAEPPKSIEYLRWGDLGYDLELPSGYDVRDCLSAGNFQERVVQLSGLLSRVSLVPGDWVSTEDGKPKSADNKQLECLPCNNYSKLITSWRKALRWTDGLDHALAVMLASVASTKSVGDQLWIKIVGPAACGKSTLCEALSVNNKYVLAKSTIRGFHSGFRVEGAGSDEDNSLISQLYDKTLVTKDGDTLLQSPNLSQILSEARDLYDSTSRTHYRNAMSKDYQGVRMTWLLCGTSSLRAIDSSELGERFLDCVIMEGIDEDLEDEVLWRVANRADQNLCLASSGKASSQYEPELCQAMQLTGGYVTWLRENAQDKLSTIIMPDPMKRQCTRLGKFTAFMRARPSIRQEETAEREFASRLVSQLTRLSKCLALVLNRKSVDDVVMRRVKQVAMDTSRGQTMAIVSHLRDAEEGMESSSVSLLIGKTEEKVKLLLRFLRAINAVELFHPESVKGVRRRPRWRLTTKMAKLYDDAVAVE